MAITTLNSLINNAPPLPEPCTPCTINICCDEKGNPLICYDFHDEAAATSKTATPKGKCGGCGDKEIAIACVGAGWDERRILKFLEDLKK